MEHFEKELIDLLTTLDTDLREKLVEMIDWEKELSWSSGYADAADYFESLEK